MFLIRTHYTAGCIPHLISLVDVKVAGILFGPVERMRIYGNAWTARVTARSCCPGRALASRDGALREHRWVAALYPVRRLVGRLLFPGR